MISKILPANSFYHTCRYICNKAGAEVLMVDGVRGHNYKLMAEDFIRQQQMRSSRKLACFHGVLSFYPGESPSNELMREVSRKYLEQLGIVNTQYSVTKHTDRAHLHLHIVANMVDYDGKSISDSYLGLRGKKVAQQLTSDYKLIPAIGKNLIKTNLENLNETEIHRYKIYQAISESLPYCRNMDELERRILKAGIETLYKFKGSTQEKQGVSFKLWEFSFKGSQVDRKFSYGNLQKAFALIQGSEMRLKGGRFEKDTGSCYSGNSIVGQIASPINGLNFDPGLQGVDILGKLYKEIQIMGGMLIKPENSHEEIPIELLKEERRQRKKRSKRMLR